MKNMNIFYKIIFSFSLFFIFESLAFGLHAEKTKRKPTAISHQAPFETKEEIQFATGVDAKLILPAHKSYYGLLKRLNARHPNTDILMVYRISNSNSVKIADVMCSETAKTLLFIGPLTPMKISKINSLQTVMGPACHVIVKDEDPLFKEKHVLVFTAKTGAYALVMQAPNGATDDEIYEIDTFVKGLQ